MPFTNGLYKVV